MSDFFKTPVSGLFSLVRMKKLTEQAFRGAARYIILNARVLERRRFDYLFGSGRGEDVVTALLPYRNPDGGFGNALEPDGRGPGSQPVTVHAALSILDEIGAVGGDLVTGVCDYLASISAPDGGIPLVHPNLRDYPRPPWWEIPDKYEGSLLSTALVLGLLYKNKVAHPWLAPATEFCWRKIDELSGTHPYEAIACVSFLDHVPDRGRAEAAAARIGQAIRARGYVALPGSKESVPDGYAPGETHFPHDYATTPESLARQWFSDEEFEAGLDALVDSQRDDGSWPVRWRIWTPVIAFEWGGWLTIEALKILRRYGRLDAR